MRFWCMLNETWNFKMVTLLVDISADHASSIDASLRDGSYSSQSELLDEALSLWQERQKQKRLAIELLRQEIDAGLASGAGRSITASDILIEFNQRANKCA